MQIKTLVIALFAGIAMTLPTDPPKNGGGGGKYNACQGNGGLYSSAQCCATDILGVANLDCAPNLFQLRPAALLPSVPRRVSVLAAVCSLSLAKLFYVRDLSAPNWVVVYT
ncbi:hypothetical protein MCOR25_007077 [Pyricularia grisea]|uniref:Hydrophobin n=1 Tax=Pyricularia grisea TaxID=148305 RepID=A0A6P8B813_PYRGI|nr:hypothetical protein PgNI_05132 [Pyricularia grisea]KAI6359383.1 hypothetical protein MCOR25_007077 [Pyricularia grisea]TLD11254.1 hypothetical protein PgNI_05132 [Pyricularia grisea]